MTGLYDAEISRSLASIAKSLEVLAKSAEKNANPPGPVPLVPNVPPGRVGTPYPYQPYVTYQGDRGEGRVQGQNER